MRKYKEFLMSYELFLESLMYVLPKMERPSIVAVEYDPKLGSVRLLLESNDFDDLRELELPPTVKVDCPSLRLG